MALKDLWISQKLEFSEKKITQIISIAGTGDIGDNSTTSLEFREFLSIVPSGFLIEYATQCLNRSFTNSGFVLQDIVNEIGVRLGFEVTFGRYRGVQGENGFDGIWLSPNSKKIIVEVKTTDTYRIKLETVTGYRKGLIANNSNLEEDISILYIVGREDTGGLECQIRGSRHAWDIRLISIDALIKLMVLKESVEDPTIIQQIHEILFPKEYTKLDELAELLFFTAEEVKQTDEEISTIDKDEKETKSVSVDFRQGIIEKIERYLKLPLVKKSYASYISDDKSISIVCAISREYERSDKKFYWFAFHPHQRDFLDNSLQGLVVLGCGSVNKVLVIPIKEFLPFLDKMNITERKNGKMYWHVHISYQAGEYLLNLRKGIKNIVLNNYILK